MPLLRNIFLFFILTGLWACGGSSYHRQLVKIDSLTLSEPQTAIKMLESLNKDGLSTADRMYLELLRIKARDKAYVEHRSDSAVVEIVSFFEGHNQGKLAEAYYYAGSVYRDMHDAPQAVAYFQKCIGALSGDGDLRMKSNACFQCGDLLRQQYLKTQAVEMIREAYRCDSIVGDTLRMADCLLQIGNIVGHDFYSVEMKDSVLSYYKEAYDLACKIGDERMKASASVNFAFVYINIGDDEKAQSYLTTIADYLATNPTDFLRFQYAELMSKLLMKQGSYDAALPYCREMLGSNSIYHRQVANENLFLIYSEKHDPVNARHFLSEFHDVADSARILTASENTAQANALYNYQLRERDNITLKAENQERLYMIFILGIFLIAALLTFWVYKLRQKQKRQILNQQLARLHQFEKMQQEQSETSAALQSLTRQSLIESQAYEIIRQRITEDQPLTDADISIIDETVNHFCDGFKSTLYSAYNLSAQEYAVCLLLKFDISATDISRLLNRTAAAITQTRKRLYQKLFGQKGSANDLDSYIRSI